MKSFHRNKPIFGFGRWSVQFAVRIAEGSFNRVFNIWIVCTLVLSSFLVSIEAQEVAEEKQKDTDISDKAVSISDKSCEECHTDPSGEGPRVTSSQIANSIHGDNGCLDCHPSIEKIPHAETLPATDCGECHDEVDEIYQRHGRGIVAKSEAIPSCADCHGSHDILSTDHLNSPVNPKNLSITCGKCHEDQAIVKEKKFLFKRPISVYSKSIHGIAAREDTDNAPHCNDCHFAKDTGHKILAAGNPESTINYFSVPKTCGKCHSEILQDYIAGIHGQLVKRGQVDAPSCTKCHGEHGIRSTADPKSPVSPYRLAEATCNPCHESAVLNEKFELSTARPVSFIDSYHGLKSKYGGKTVANCASCHGAHRILPSSEPESSIHKENLATTCGGCHEGISEELASIPIHQTTAGRGSGWPRMIQVFYIWLIVVVISGMFLYVILDFLRCIRKVMQEKQVKRMEINEVIQHMILALSFIVLVVTGFSLRYYDVWWSRLLFGFEGGYQWRGLIHRIGAVVLMLAALWHAVFLLTKRGRTYLSHISPRLKDFTHLLEMLAYNLGRRSEPPQMGRFSFVEKVEYWSLVFGTVIMTVTGTILWFKTFMISFISRELLDICLVIHTYEAWLAFLAIIVWHLYHTVLSPKVYPINPAWLTGKMPERAFVEEHAAVTADPGAVTVTLSKDKESE